MYLPTYNNQYAQKKKISFSISTNLNGLEFANIVATEMLQDNATGNPIGAQSMKDGLLEPSHGGKGRVDVHRVAIPTEPIQGSLQG